MVITSAAKFEDNSFDVILGNIPFNSVKIYDRRYNELNPYIHDYFFIKSLDLAKPGGIIAFITSKGILDRKDESLREYIARRAEFIGAIRLPNTAFKMLAGTEVTADIVFLKKRAVPMQLDRTNNLSWIQTDLERGKWITITASTMRMVLNSTRWKRNGSSFRPFMFRAMASWWESTRDTGWRKS